MGEDRAGFQPFALFSGSATQADGLGWDGSRLWRWVEIEHRDSSIALSLARTIKGCRFWAGKGRGSI